MALRQAKLSLVNDNFKLLHQQPHIDLYKGWTEQLGNQMVLEGRKY